MFILNFTATDVDWVELKATERIGEYVVSMIKNLECRPKH